MPVPKGWAFRQKFFDKFFSGKRGSDGKESNRERLDGNLVSDGVNAKFGAFEEVQSKYALMFGKQPMRQEIIDLDAVIFLRDAKGSEFMEFKHLDLQHSDGGFDICEADWFAQIVAGH